MVQDLGEVKVKMSETVLILEEVGRGTKANSTTSGRYSKSQNEPVGNRSSCKI
jgi:hypothetical protein